MQENMTPQEIYDELRDKTVKQSAEKKLFKEILEDNGTYVSLTEDMTALRLDRNKVIEEVSSKHPQIVEKISDLNVEVKALRELLDVTVVSELRKGNKVEVTDSVKGKKELYPILSVKFGSHQQQLPL